MKIIKFKAENVKKLKAIEIIPEGNIVKITGKNEQGKTTVLDAIWWALGGTKDIQNQPLRQGQSEGKIELDLGELIVTRTFNSKSGGGLEVKNKVGSKVPLKSPQAILDGLIGKYTFNPLEFAKADKKKQVEILLSIVDLQPDYEKLEQISGHKPRSTDPLEVMNEVFKYIYDERTIVNRDLEKTKKVLESLPQGIVKTEPVVTVELLAERERLERENKNNDKLRENIGNLSVEADNIVLTINDVKTEIKQLQNKLEELEGSLQKKNEEVQKNIVEVAKIKDNDLTEINRKIATADQINEKAAQWRRQEEVISDIIEYQQEADALTKKLDEIKKYKDELVKKAKFPVTGLDFGNGGVLYQGLPFEQASGTARLKVSMAIGMALKPELRIIQIDEANGIDSDHWKVIQEMAQENDFQVWCTMMDESGQVGIYIEDGEIKNGQ